MMTSDLEHILFGSVFQSQIISPRSDGQPRRSFYIAIGHDEEVGGDDGAHAIGQLLLSRGVNPAFLLDEGTVVHSGVFPGIQDQIVEIAVGEKGQIECFDFI